VVLAFRLGTPFARRKSAIWRTNVTTIRKILCPVDCSEGSRIALDHAIALAVKFDAQIELLHAWHVTYHVRPDLSVWAEAHGHRPILDVVEAEAEADVRASLSTVHPGVRARLDVRNVQGEAAPTIVKFAESDDIDLIVMGTHGRSGLSHLALGSVAERVVRHAPCPVLTVRMPEGE
jgi:universal stress protein A